MKLENGKYYRNGRGKHIGPIEPRRTLDYLGADDPYLFKGVDRYGWTTSYTPDGRYLVGQDSDRDLVEEVGAP